MYRSSFDNCKHSPPESEYKLFHLFRKFHGFPFQSTPPDPTSLRQHCSNLCNYRLALFILDLPAHEWNDTV